MRGPDGGFHPPYEDDQVDRREADAVRGGAGRAEHGLADRRGLRDDQRDPERPDPRPADDDRRRPAGDPAPRAARSSRSGPRRRRPVAAPVAVRRPHRWGDVGRAVRGAGRRLPGHRASPRGGPAGPLDRGRVRSRPGGERSPRRGRRAVGRAPRGGCQGGRVAGRAPAADRREVCGGLLRRDPRRRRPDAGVRPAGRRPRARDGLPGRHARPGRQRRGPGRLEERGSHPSAPAAPRRRSLTEVAAEEFPSLDAAISGHSTSGRRPTTAAATCWWPIGRWASAIPTGA